mgnify:CR=1 FL=1
MKSYAQIEKRRQEAQKEVDFLIKLLKQDAGARLGGGVDYAYVAGYLGSMIAGLASESPMAMKRLQTTVRGAMENRLK